MLLTDAYRECMKPARNFWSYLLFCFERYCHQLKLHLELPATTVDGKGADGDKNGPYTAPGGNIHMHPERAAEFNEFITKFVEALEKLTPKDRLRILMHYFLYMSLASCAEALGISEDNAKVRLFHARLRLGRMLLDDAYFKELIKGTSFWGRFYDYGYWKHFSDSVLRYFASKLDFVWPASKEEASADEQDEDVV